MKKNVYSEGRHKMAFAHRREPRPIGEMIREREQALEAADNGHRQELAIWNEIAAIGQAVVREPLDPELQRVLSSDLARMRELGIEAMKLSDANREQEGMAEMHVRAGQLVNEIDEMAGLLRGLES